MRKEVTAIFTLTNEEIREALYNVFVSKGKKLGESLPQKGFYWGIYFYNKQYFISLNDQYSDVWEADEEDAENYNEIPCQS